MTALTVDNVLWLVFAALVVAGWRASTNLAVHEGARLVGVLAFWGPASWILIFKAARALL